MYKSENNQHCRIATSKDAVAIVVYLLQTTNMQRKTIDHYTHGPVQHTRLASHQLSLQCSLCCNDIGVQMLSVGGLTLPDLNDLYDLTITVSEDTRMHATEL